MHHVMFNNWRSKRSSPMLRSNGGGDTSIVGYMRRLLRLTCGRLHLQSLTPALMLVLHVLHATWEHRDIPDAFQMVHLQSSSVDAGGRAINIFGSAKTHSC